MNAILRAKVYKPRPRQESLPGAVVDLIALLVVLAIYGMAAALVVWGAV